MKAHILTTNQLNPSRIKWGGDLKNIPLHTIVLVFSFTLLSVLSGCLGDGMSIKASNWTNASIEVLIVINDTNQEFLNETYPLEPRPQSNQEDNRTVLFSNLKKELGLSAGLYTLTASSGNFSDSVEFGLGYVNIDSNSIWIDVHPDRLKVTRVE